MEFWVSNHWSALSEVSVLYISQKEKKTHFNTMHSYLFAGIFSAVSMIHSYAFSLHLMYMLCAGIGFELGFACVLGGSVWGFPQYGTVHHRPVHQSRPG